MANNLETSRMNFNRKPIFDNFPYFIKYSTWPDHGLPLLIPGACGPIHQTENGLIGDATMQA
jgi:hypothetical protein